MTARSLLCFIVVHCATSSRATKMEKLSKLSAHAFVEKISRASPGHFSEEDWHPTPRNENPGLEAVGKKRDTVLVPATASGAQGVVTETVDKPVVGSGVFESSISSDVPSFFHGWASSKTVLCLSILCNVFCVCFLATPILNSCCFGESSVTEDPANPIGELRRGAGEDGSPTRTIENELSELNQKKAKLMFERVINQKKLEAVLATLGSKETQGKSIEENLQGAKEAVEAIDLTVQRGLVTILAYATPVLMQGQRLQGMVARRTESILEKTRKLALEEAGQFKSDVQNILDVDNFGLRESLTDSTLPTLGVLASSLAAMIQIRASHLGNLVSFIQTTIFGVLSFMAVPIILRKPCHEGTSMESEVVVWFLIDGFVNVLCVLVSFKALRMTSASLERLNTNPPVEPVKDAAEGLRFLVDHYTSAGNDALLELHGFKNSIANKLNNLSGFVSIVMIIAGSDLAFNTDWDDCSGIALIALCILRLRVVLGLMLFLPILLTNVFFALLFFARENFREFLLTSAANVDDAMQLGMPIASALVRSFLFHSRGELLDIELKMAKRKAQHFRRMHDAAKKELQSVASQETEARKESERLLEEKKAEDAKTRETLVCEHERLKADILDKAESFFRKINAIGKMHADEVFGKIDSIDRQRAQEFINIAETRIWEADTVARGALRQVASSAGVQDASQILVSAAEQAKRVVANTSVGDASQLLASAAERAGQAISSGYVQDATEFLTNQAKKVASSSCVQDATQLALSAAQQARNAAASSTGLQDGGQLEQSTTEQARSVVASNACVQDVTLRQPPVRTIIQAFDNHTVLPTVTAVPSVDCVVKNPAIIGSTFPSAMLAATRDAAPGASHGLRMLDTPETAEITVSGGSAGCSGTTSFAAVRFATVAGSSPEISTSAVAAGAAATSPNCASPHVAAAGDAAAGGISSVTSDFGGCHRRPPVGSHGVVGTDRAALVGASAGSCDIPGDPVGASEDVIGGDRAVVRFDAVPSVPEPGERI